MYKVKNVRCRYYNDNNIVVVNTYVRNILGFMP